MHSLSLVKVDLKCITHEITQFMRKPHNHHYTSHSNYIDNILYFTRLLESRINNYTCAVYNKGVKVYIFLLKDDNAEEIGCLGLVYLSDDNFATALYMTH